MKTQIKTPKTGFFEFTLIFATFMLTLIAFPACNNTKPKDTKEVAEEHNEAKFENSKEDDAEFLVTAAEINLEEIQLGKLAQSKSVNAEVKSLGKMMETEHTKALADLQMLASKKQITIPTTLTDDGIEANKKLMDMKTSMFDKEYCDMMVNGHQNAISKFEKAATDASDPDIRNWASSMLPALRIHLDHSLTCQKNCEKM